MLQSRSTPTQKRGALRARIAAGLVTVMPGTIDPLVTRMIERRGFAGAYVSGHMLAASLGLPDIGLTTATEAADAAGAIARMTDLPVLVDADTGFGGGAMPARTVQLLEDAGVAGCHIEDQADPKRVGGSGVRLVGEAEAVRRIKTAVAGRRDPAFLIIARTDAMPVEGLDSALRRARPFVEAGADMVFVEGLLEPTDIARAREALGVPLLLNWRDRPGVAPLTMTDLRSLGVALVIHPLALLRLALKAVDDGLACLAATDGFLPLARRMFDPADLAGTLDAAAYAEMTS